jgi:prophage regulatory protein
LVAFQPKEFHMDTHTPPQPDRLLKVPEVCKLVTWSRSKVYEAIAAGEFPRPIRLSTNRVAFRESDIAGWISAKAGEARHG